MSRRANTSKSPHPKRILPKINSSFLPELSSPAVVSQDTNVLYILSDNNIVSSAQEEEIQYVEEFGATVSTTAGVEDDNDTIYEVIETTSDQPTDDVETKSIQIIKEAVIEEQDRQEDLIDEENNEDIVYITSDQVQVDVNDIEEDEDDQKTKFMQVRDYE